MSWKMMIGVHQLAVTKPHIDLTHAQYRVLMILADHAGEDGTNSRPGITRIAKAGQMSERTVTRALHELQHHGLIAGDQPPTETTPGVWRLLITVNLTAQQNPPKGDDNLSEEGRHFVQTGVTKSPNRDDKMSPNTKTQPKEENQRKRTSTPISPKSPSSDHSSPADAGRLRAHEVMEIWNRLVGKKLPNVTVLTDGREKKIRAFTARYVKTAEGFEAYVQQILRTPFLIGQNDRGWRASLDFAIRPDQYAKIIEGAYQRLASHERPYDYSQGPATPL